MNRDFAFSLFRWVRSTIPITSILVLIVVCLQIAVDWRTTPHRKPADAYRDLGLLEVQHSPEHPDLFGPFDLWAGQWWRVPMGGLHQGGWWQIALIVPATIYLGVLLEPRLHPATFGLFVVGALMATTLARWRFSALSDWFVGEDPMTGLAGVIFAAFGALLLLRRDDRTLNRQFSDGGILLGAVCGLGFLALSVGGWTTGVDNLAHVVGLLYGLVWGLVLSAPPVARPMATIGLVAAHGLLWFPFHHIMHPGDDGRYHWWLAETSPDAATKKLHYESAVKHEPTLTYPWYALAETELETGQPGPSWRTLLRGLDAHRGLQNAENLSRRIWDRFPGPEDRKAAWQTLDETFPGDRDYWRDRLLTPRQSLMFLMTQNEPLGAWRSCMRLLRTFKPPHNSPSGVPIGEAADVSNLAATIWKRLSSQGDKYQALGIMDQILDRDRRAWQLALIPNRDLILHYQNLGESLWAWRAVMIELRDEPTFLAEGKRIAGEIWPTLPTELRRERARDMVDEIFGVRGLDWQVELDILSEATKHRYRLDQSVKLPPWEPLDEPKPAATRPACPDSPARAVLGVGL